jgi:hypothetical protein
MKAKVGAHVGDLCNATQQKRASLFQFWPKSGIMSFGGDHGIPVAEENPYGVGIAVPGAGGYYQASPPTMTHHQQQPPPHQPFIPNAQPTYQQQQFVPPQPTFGAGGAGIAQVRVTRLGNFCFGVNCIILEYMFGIASHDPV